MTRKSNPTHINRDGLVFEALLDGNAYDTSGNGNDGNPINVSWELTGRGYQKRCAGLSGSGYITYPNTSNLQLTNSFTIHLAVRKTNTTAAYALCKGANYYAIIKDYVSNVYEFYSNQYTGDNPRTAMNTSITDTEWHLISWTYDGTTIKGYLDGVIDVSATKAFTLSTDTGLLYQGRSNAGDYFVGQQGGLRIYKGVVESEDEIEVKYLEFNRLFGPTNLLPSSPILRDKTNVVAEYPLNGDVLDYSGNGNHGTPSNMDYSPVWGGRVGKFDGSSSGYIVPHNSILNIANQITMYAWVKSSSTATQYIIVKRIANSTDGYELSFSGSGKAFVRFNQNSQGNTYRLDSLSNYSTNGDWDFWCATYDGSTIKIYKNAELDNSLSATFSIGTNSDSLYIGRDNSGGYLDGNMFMGGIISGAIPQSEIKSLKEQGIRYLYPQVYTPTALPKPVLSISKPQVGGQYIDQSGNGNNSTSVTNVTDSSLGMYNVMSFNGSSDIIFPDSLVNSDLQGLSQIAFEFVGVKKKANGIQQTLFFVSTSSANAGIEISFLSDNTMRIAGRSQTSDSYQQLVSSRTYTDTTKVYHIVGIYDYANDNLKLYVNGEKIIDGTVSFGATSLNYTVSTGRVVAGSIQGGGEYYLNGDISAINIYPEGLNQTQIQQLYYSSKII